MFMDKNIIDKINWTHIIVTALISAPISAIIMIIFSKTFEQTPVSKLLVFFVIFLILLCIILILFQIPKWIKSRRLQIRILPEDKISISVDGRELTIVMYNKNEFDVNCKINLSFPRFLRVFQSSNFQGNILGMKSYGNETNLIENLESERVEIKDKVYDTEINVISTSEYRITFKLMPEEYNRNGYIFYRIESQLKTINGKIEVNT